MTILHAVSWFLIFATIFMIILRKPARWTNLTLLAMSLSGALDNALEAKYVWLGINIFFVGVFLVATIVSWSVWKREQHLECCKNHE